MPYSLIWILQGKRVVILLILYHHRILEKNKNKEKDQKFSSLVLRVFISPFVSALALSFFHFSFYFFIFLFLFKFSTCLPPRLIFLQEGKAGASWVRPLQLFSVEASQRKPLTSSRQPCNASE